MFARLVVRSWHSTTSPDRSRWCSQVVSASALFGTTAIYDVVAAGWIPYLRFDSSIRFDPIAIADWMREHTVPLAA
jgi:hypothetical protein